MPQSYKNSAIEMLESDFSGLNVKRLQYHNELIGRLLKGVDIVENI